MSTSVVDFVADDDQDGQGNEEQKSDDHEEVVPSWCFCNEHSRVDSSRDNCGAKGGKDDANVFKSRSPCLGINIIRFRPCRNDGRWSWFGKSVRTVCARCCTHGAMYRPFSACMWWSGYNQASFVKEVPASIMYGSMSHSGFDSAYAESGRRSRADDYGGKKNGPAQLMARVLAAAAPRLVYRMAYATEVK